MNLTSLEAVQSYLTHVPSSYHRYIHQLTITTTPKDQPAFPPSAVGNNEAVSNCLIQLLGQCTQVEQLTLNLNSSVSKSVVSVFGDLEALTALTINYVGDERQAPL